MRWPKALLPLLPALVGCDIVQGFQDASDTLFPEQSTHLSAPAVRFVGGGYTGLDLVAGRELSVLTRSTEKVTSLFVIPFASPRPCEIPEVGRYQSNRNPDLPEARIAYFHEDVAQGTLRFANTSCRRFDLEIENARLPVGETERGVIVWAGEELLSVDPEGGELSTLASGVTDIVGRAFSGRALVLSAGQLEVFDSEWRSQGRFGEAVRSVLKTSQGALYLDATGLRRLSAGRDNRSTLDTLIVADACNLNMRDSTWATFYAPCAEKQLRALNEPSGRLYSLELNADPAYLRLFPAHGSRGVSPVEDPFWFVFLRDVSSAGGTFVVRDPQGAEQVIGESATLLFSDLIDSGTAPYGYALVNVAERSGDYVYFDAQGARKTLARHVYTGNNRLLVDWDGSSGTLAVASGDRLARIAEGVPDAPFAFTDPSQEWTVLFHDVRAGAGTLSRITGTLGSLERTPRGAPFAAPALDEVATNVAIYSTSSLDALIPGTVFLTGYDTSTGTGLLSYENAQLRFKAVVASGVSSYLFSNDYLLYTIPFGRDRGIWLATGK